MGTELLLRTPHPDADRRILEWIRNSARRIGALVENVLKLARG